MTSPSDRALRPLAGRMALVTGGGRGIGRAICLSLAGAGALVVPVSRNSDELATVTREIADAGGLTSPGLHVGDVRSFKEIERVVSELHQAGIDPDILVPAAGIAKYTEIVTLDPEEWNEHLAVNLSGAFHAIRAVLPAMLERGRGDVVTIVSVAGIKAFPACGAYSASKFGLLGLTRVLREEVRGRGIRVTAVIPGATDTALWGTSPPVSPERMMRPETVAGAVLHAVTADRRAVIEEIVLRPALGDL